jgi:hypothetical protein
MNWLFKKFLPSLSLLPVTWNLTGLRGATVSGQRFDVSSEVPADGQVLRYGCDGLWFCQRILGEHRRKGGISSSINKKAVPWRV